MTHSAHTPSGFAFLSHTADIKITAWAPDFSHALIEAAKACTHLVTEGAALPAEQEYSIAIRAATREDLLFNYLSHLVYLLDAKHFLALEGELRADSQVNPQTKKTEWFLSGVLLGYVRTPDDLRQELRAGHIKAATYHDLAIHDTHEKTELIFVLDI